jgi:hypothetical protein
MAKLVSAKYRRKGRGSFSATRRPPIVHDRDHACVVGLPELPELHDPEA